MVLKIIPQKDVNEMSNTNNAAPVPTAAAIIKLNVPFDEKDQVKALGARWDKEGKFWFISKSVDVKPFDKWMPPIKLNVLFDEKDQAKALGARWDKEGKFWYVNAGMDLKPFEDWLPLSENARKLKIFTDGSCNPNPGPGGYAYVIRRRKRKDEIFSEGYKSTTNNRMELLACLAALRTLKERCNVIIFTDSQYVVNGIEKKWASHWKTNGWKLSGTTDDVENSDLWAELLEFSRLHNITFKWIRGHRDHKINNICDRMAKEAKRLKRDVIYETGNTRGAAGAQFAKAVKI